MKPRQEINDLARSSWQDNLHMSKGIIRCLASYTHCTGRLSPLQFSYLSTRTSPHMSMLTIGHSLRAVVTSHKRDHPCLRVNGDTKPPLTQYECEKPEGSRHCGTCRSAVHGRHAHRTSMNRYCSFQSYLLQ